MKPSTIVLMDDRHQPIGHVGQSYASGWLWACALCPAANAPGGGSEEPDTALRQLLFHLRLGHPVNAPATS